MPSSSSDADVLWDQYWLRPDDRHLLQVYADALEQRGDPRGAFLQLSLLEHRTDEQEAKREALLRRHKGALVGGASRFLRQFELSRTTGLVTRARTELPRLLAGLDELGRLNPRLILTLTSVKTLKDAATLGAVSPARLGRIHFIDFCCLTNPGAPTDLDDKKLAAIAPAFSEVEHVQLSCRARCFSPEGLRVFGGFMKRLRFLSIDFYSFSPGVARPYLDAIALTPGFASLRGLQLGAAHDLTSLDVSARNLNVKFNPMQARTDAWDPLDGLAERLATSLA